MALYYGKRNYNKFNAMEAYNNMNELISGLVWEYINDVEAYGKGARIAVYPETGFVRLLTEKDYYNAVEDNDEAVENAAYAFGGRDEEYTDFQANQNPDFYWVEDLIETVDGKRRPDEKKIAEIKSNE